MTETCSPLAGALNAVHEAYNRRPFVRSLTGTDERRDQPLDTRIDAGRQLSSDNCSNRHVWDRPR